jgi:hypothetical protein
LLLLLLKENLNIFSLWRKTILLIRRRQQSALTWRSRSTTRRMDERHLWEKENECRRRHSFSTNVCLCVCLVAVVSHTVSSMCVCFWRAWSSCQCVCDVYTHTHAIIVSNRQLGNRRPTWLDHAILLCNDRRRQTSSLCISYSFIWASVTTSNTTRRRRPRKDKERGKQHQDNNKG